MLTFNTHGAHAIMDSGFTIDAEANSAVQGLSAAHNPKIHFVPIKISEKFPNLRGMEINSCHVKEISEENFRNLNKLEHLSLFSNKITKIVPQTFKDLKELQILWLTENEITEIASDVFEGLTKLEELHLEKNQLTTIDFTIHHLAALHKFFIAYNSIATIPSDFFNASHSNLRWIRMQNNKFTAIPSTLFDPIREQLKSVDLRENSCIDFRYIFNVTNYAVFKEDLAFHCPFVVEVVEVTTTEVSEKIVKFEMSQQQVTPPPPTKKTLTVSIKDSIDNRVN